jgi:sigma-54 dependent transcriptional regulator, acetoin dehydrogenase operon transcriptional activator AcoR
MQRSQQIFEALPLMLAESWKRSVHSGLRRDDRVLYSPSYSRIAARRNAEKHETLLAHALPEMNRLFEGLGSAKWLVMCLDVRGHILVSVGDKSSSPRELKPLMNPGRSLLECELGTTAPGCALASGRPAVVTRGEHFLLELGEFFCASSLIAGPDGSRFGVLDISGVGVDAIPLAADLVTGAARRVENRLIAGERDCFLVHFHCDERELDSPYEGLIAITSDGFIKGMNRAAKKMLSLPFEQPNTKGLDSLFEGGVARLLRCVRSNSTERVRICTGLRPYVRISSPSPMRPAGSCSVTGRAQPERQNLRIGDRNLRNQMVKAQRVLANGVSVLLSGETGSGKELIARALHSSVRPMGPFVTVNSATTPESLMESELFGYEEGVGVRAGTAGSAGKVAQARGGVLFIDEIADMPLPMQGRLLQVLKEQATTQFKSGQKIPVDFVLISATHRNIAVMVEAQQFRKDLLLQIQGYEIAVPPFRDRSDRRDLVEHIIRLHFSASFEQGDSAELLQLIEPEAMELLIGFDWPGNIRQLVRVIRGLVALWDPGHPICVLDLPSEVRLGYVIESAAASIPRAVKPLRQSEAETIHAVLKVHGGNVSSAARALGISRGTLYTRLKRYRADQPQTLSASATVTEPRCRSEGKKREPIRSRRRSNC